MMDNGDTSFSIVLGCVSMFPRVSIGPPIRSACWSILILLGLYVYRKYFNAKIGPMPAPTMSCTRKEANINLIRCLLLVINKFC